MNRLREYLQRLDPIDFAWGGAFCALVTLASGFGLSDLVVVLVGSLLWAVGGAPHFGKAWRRVGCPALVGLSFIIKTGSWLGVPAALATFGVLTLGYGLPSTQPPDEGSMLGRIAWKLAKGNENLATLYARGTIYAAAWLCFFVASVLK